FLSGQFSPEPSFLGLPFSMPMRPMKLMPSNCLRLTVRAARACGLRSSGLSPERAVQNRLERAAVDVRGLGVASGGAGDDPALEHLAPLIRAVSDGELADEHFAAAVLRAREHAVLTDIAGADVKHERRGGAVRDHLELRRWSIGIIVAHGASPLGLGGVLRWNDGQGLALAPAGR